MTEGEIKAREQAARRELPQTSAAFDRVRARAVEKLVVSKPDESIKREELYRLVHILDSVQAELVSACGQGSEAIEAYIEGMTTKPATTGNP